MLRTGMLGDSVHLFTRHLDKDKIYKILSRIRSYAYGKESKLKKNITGFDANTLYLYCSGDVMPFGKDTLVLNEKPFDRKQIAKFLKDVLKRKVLSLHRLIFRYLKGSVTNLVKWHRCYLFKIYPFLIYLRQLDVYGKHW